MLDQVYCNACENSFFKAESKDGRCPLCGAVPGALPPAERRSKSRSSESRSSAGVGTNSSRDWGFPLASEKTKTMQILMAKSDGRANLREFIEQLNRDASAWEKLAMAAIVFQKAAAILERSLKTGNVTQESVASAFTRAGNVLDGAPGTEDVVAMCRNAARKPESCDWIRLAHEAAVRWAGDVKDFLDAAKQVKGAGSK